MLNWLRRQAIPLVKFIGRVSAPWVVKQMTGVEYGKIHQLVSPGDILLTRVSGHLSNVLIPGYWKHAAIVAADKESVIEAVGKGVCHTDLITFVTSKDEIVVLRPTFGTAAEGLAAARFAESKVGMPYDYDFTLGNRAFYCAELVYMAYRKTFGAFGFGPRERLGVKTVTADDFFEAQKYWRDFYDSRERGLPEAG